MSNKKNKKKVPETTEQLADVEEEVPVLETVPAEEHEAPAVASDPEYGKLEHMLIVCQQCGRAYLVPSGESLPDACICGLQFDYDNKDCETEVAIPEPMTLVVRKVPRKFVPR